MANMGSILIAFSAAIVLILGSAHLFFTFKGNKFFPRDADLMLRLQQVSPIISRQTTMWDAGLGFHASHSLGAMMFGILYIYLAFEETHLLFHSLFLQCLGLGYLAIMLFLAKRYWFTIPFRGLLISITFYLSALLIVHV